MPGTSGVDDLKGRQELYNGFGDTLARGFELVAIPLLLAGIGFLVDGLAGTRPLVTIILGLFGLAGVSVRMYYGYDVAMKTHADAAPWSGGRRSGSASAARVRADEPSGRLAPGVRLDKTDDISGGPER